MAVIKGAARQTTSIERKGEGVELYMRMLRDGTVGMAEWINLLSLEGRVFTANVGTGTAVATFGAGTLNTAEFDLHVSVPSTVAIIPIALEINYEAYGTDQIMETIMASGGGSTCGVGTTITPISSNVSSGLSSACTVTGKATATSGVYMTTNVKEIFRESAVVTQTPTISEINPSPTIFRWFAKDSGIYDVVGPSQQLGIFTSAQAGTGYITLKYAELPVTAVS